MVFSEYKYKTYFLRKLVKYIKIQREMNKNPLHNPMHCSYSDLILSSHLYISRTQLT